MLQLFIKHGHDAELHMRHIAALQKLSRTGGFAIRDLPIITDILEHTLDLVLKSQHTAVFLEPACNLIRCEMSAAGVRESAAVLAEPANSNTLLFVVIGLP